MVQTGVVMRILGVGGIVVLAAGVAAAQPLFRTAQLYNLPGSTSDTLGILAVADVGSPGNPPGAPDHLLDLVTANQNESVSVLLGNGNGGFSLGLSSDLGIIPTALAVADFDEDTILDLLVTDTGTAVFLRGNNDGTFQPPGSPNPAGTNPAAIAAADINGDHHMDAIIVDEGGFSSLGAVTLLIGNGDGTFKPPGPSVEAGFGSKAVALVDLDGDGMTDQLAVANAGASTLSILQGDGAGHFSPAQTVEVPPTTPVAREPVAIAADDFNGDGRPDLVVVSRSTDEIGIFNGLAGDTYGNSRFFPSGTVGSAPNGLALADMDRDGHTDVAVSNHFSSDASVLFGDGLGNFHPARAFVTDLEPLAVVAANFNGDLLPDVVTINAGQNNPNVAVLLGEHNARVTGVEDVGVEADPTGTVAGDVDNDGVSDLVVVHNNGDVLVRLSDPAIGFAPPLMQQAAGDATAVGSGDLNADGILDVVVINKIAMNVSVFLGTVDGALADPHNYPVGAGASAIAMGDWNRDGRSDVAVARQGSGPSGAVDILLANANGSLGAPVSFAVAQFPTSIDVGDFNNDGKLDLVVGNSQDVSLALGNGNGTFQLATSIAGTAGGAVGIAVADFDRDGSDDMAIARPVGISSGVTILYGDGHGAFAPPDQPLRVSGFPSAVAARDVTGDFFPDVIITDQTSNAVSIFVRSGSTRRFVRDSAFTVSRQPVRALAADLDGDGRYDALTVNSAVASSVSVLTNSRAAAVLRGDANGDGTVTAADLTGVMRELGDGNGTRIEQVRVSGGSYPAAPGVDANGDGLVTLQDAIAAAHRLFLGS